MTLTDEVTYSVSDALPGCLPEGEPARFESLADAREFAASLLKGYAEEFADAEQGYRQEAAEAQQRASAAQGSSDWQAEAREALRYVGEAEEAAKSAAEARALAEEAQSGEERSFRLAYSGSYRYVEIAEQGSAQPTVTLTLRGEGMSASYFALSARGEVLETVEVLPESGLPDWREAGCCDERGSSPEAFKALSEALYAAEANQKALGHPVERVAD